MIIIAGPCQLESIDHTLMMADLLADVSRRLGLPIIFKASFDKANRTSGKSPRGAGMTVAQSAFRRLRNLHPGMQITTDVHEAWQCSPMADFVDILQIPALLSRQSDLIEAAANTGRAMTIKRGQFMAPTDMKFAVDKARDGGADIVWAIERGSSFGYHNLVVDMRAIPIMANSGADRVLFDATHSVQQPGSLGGATGGDRAMVMTLAQAAIGAGADGLFVETHQDPDNAPSDGPVMLPAGILYDFLARMRDLHAFMKGL